MVRMGAGGGRTFAQHEQFRFIWQWPPRLDVAGTSPPSRPQLFVNIHGQPSRARKAHEAATSSHGSSSRMYLSEQPFKTYFLKLAPKFSISRNR